MTRSSGIDGDALALSLAAELPRAPADSGGGSPAVSADGRFVAFDSQSSNLVVNDTNDAVDVFVRDRTLRGGLRATRERKTDGNKSRDSAHARELYQGRGLGARERG